MITVKLYGVLNRYNPEKASTLVVAPAGPTTAGELLRGAGLPLDLLEMVLRNGQPVDLDAAIEDGDLLEAFPLVGGGGFPMEQQLTVARPLMAG